MSSVIKNFRYCIAHWPFWALTGVAFSMGNLSCSHKKKLPDQMFVIFVLSLVLPGRGSANLRRNRVINLNVLVKMTECDTWLGPFVFLRAKKVGARVDGQPPVLPVGVVEVDEDGHQRVVLVREIVVILSTKHEYHKWLLKRLRFWGVPDALGTGNPCLAVSRGLWCGAAVCPCFPWFVPLHPADCHSTASWWIWLSSFVDCGSTRPYKHRSS